MLNLKEVLNDINNKYAGSDDILGKNLLTLANRVNSSRALMISNQLDQTLVLVNPEFPKVFTNNENIVGKYSSAYYRAEHDYIVVDKISKFEDKPDYIYTLVVYDRKNKKYDIIEKYHVENLTENHGYRYNTEVLDRIEIDDVIDKGEILYKSTSFDENMNYRYGVNLRTLYTIDDRTIEDAIVLSESAAKKLASIEVDKERISLNDNDIFINLYGDKEEYRSFPDVGEPIKNKTLLAKRRKVYSQALFDLKQDNMCKVNYKTDIVHTVTSYEKPARVIDINVYCNKRPEEVVRSSYNAQVIKYYDNEMRYHNEIIQKLGALKDQGLNCSDDLNFMYKRSKDILDPTVKWKDSNSSKFNNMIIEFIIEKETTVYPGSKLTGRYGDKGVISTILPDDQMPMLETGERVEMICNALGVINRLNPAQLYEVELNFIGNRVKESIMTMSDRASKEQLMFKFYSIVNMTEHDALHKFYYELPEDEKNKFIENIEESGFHIHQPPMYGNADIQVIERLYIELNIKPYTCYINRFGRKIKMMNKLVIGEKYILKLKHTPEGKFSSRSTGFLNSKDQPSKSSAKNSIYQKTPIKMGEMEYNNLLMNFDPYTLRDMSMIYSTSTIARRNSGQLYENDVLNLEDIEIDDEATNRSAEILSVYLRNIGVGLVFEDDED